jgi:hypothetical protein
MILRPRKRFFIHSGIQGALMLRLLVQWGLFVGMTCIVSLALQWLLDPLAPAEERMLQLRISLGSFVLVSLCLLPIFIKDAVMFSHRFVGPVIRLQSEMRKVDEVSELRTFKLRTRDYWQVLAEDYNGLVERLQSSVREAEIDRSAAMSGDGAEDFGSAEEVT